jgi:hypothetical protein
MNNSKNKWRRKFSFGKNKKKKWKINKKGNNWNKIKDENKYKWSPRDSKKINGNKFYKKGDYNNNINKSK